MDLNSFSVNFAALFIATASTTYALTNDGSNGYEIRVWDQFGENLMTIGNLDEEEVWNEWTKRWVLLVVAENSGENKKLKSNYWKEKVIDQTGNLSFVSESLGNDQKNNFSSTNDEKRIQYAQSKKSEIRSRVRKLQEECEYAYGRHINRDSSWYKSWFNSASQRTKLEEKDNKKEKTLNIGETFLELALKREM
ncbi:hypothetical protein [Candidatus Mycoplasma haematohominis]|uniref:hypothetical protein n=1 Tax=Candidatus Mycoplasma haematohominis TaxID=1494318 RepID=UPI001C0A69B3|nr:hypothetical protein [Candidatus Mycoplasma haemohominis]